MEGNSKNWNFVMEQPHVFDFLEPEKIVKCPKCGTEKAQIIKSCGRISIFCGCCGYLDSVQLTRKN